MRKKRSFMGFCWKQSEFEIADKIISSSNSRNQLQSNTTFSHFHLSTKPNIIRSRYNKTPHTESHVKIMGSSNHFNKFIQEFNQNKDNALKKATRISFIIDSLRNIPNTPSENDFGTIYLNSIYNKEFQKLEAPRALSSFRNTMCNPKRIVANCEKNGIFKKKYVYNTRSPRRKRCLIVNKS